MDISPITFDYRGPTAKDHGTLFGAALRDGILDGVAVTYTGQLLTFAAGHLIAAGREMKLTAAQTVTISAVSGYARVLLQIDLSQTASETEFAQLSVLTQTAESLASLPALTQEDINAGGLIYQAELATVACSSTGITGVISSMPRAGIWGTTATLTAAGWSEGVQTVSVPGVGADSLVVVAPAPASYEAWGEHMVRCSAQGAGTLTFAAGDTPTEALTANILIVR